MLYDLWLSSGVRNRPQFNDLTASFPVLADAALLARMQEQTPSFLGLDLPENVAQLVLARLKADWARGMIVLSTYRQPLVTQQTAYQFAEQYIHQQKQQRYADFTLKPIRFDRAHAMWWTFKAEVVELVAQGKIPGALFASIDKLDGHVWQPEEFERLFGDQQ